MPVFALNDELVFPDPELASPSGLLALGGDLRPERLLLAYRLGIFPWFDAGMPFLWHSPDPRMVLYASQLHVGRSLGKTLRKHRFELRMDTAFSSVIRHCSAFPRPGQDGTWITDEMIAAYEALHALGYAHSVEAWLGGELVGGLYGVSLGGAYFGESMFALCPDASKVAFATFVTQLRRWRIELVDCQVYTDHLARFGAVEIPRRLYLRQLREALGQPDRVGVWRFDPDLERSASKVPA
jgi:leucyl/phenylalanyl-tRNA--protein transferase